MERALRGGPAPGFLPRTFRRASGPPDDLSRIFEGIGSLDGVLTRSIRYSTLCYPVGRRCELSVHHRVLWNQFQDLPADLLHGGEPPYGLSRPYGKSSTTAMQ